MSDGETTHRSRHRHPATLKLLSSTLLRVVFRHIQSRLASQPSHPSFQRLSAPVQPTEDNV